MKSNLSSFAVGFLFAIGLGLAGLTQPGRVIGFLDVGGNWDPALLWVMIGAVLTHSILYRIIRKRATPVLQAEWDVPTSREITPRLVAGAAIFGLGWGIAGYCPAPVVTSLVTLHPKPFVFVAAMLVGMLSNRIWLFRA